MTESALPQAQLFAALAKFQAELPTIAKEASARIEAENKKPYSYKYADLADVAEVVEPLIGKQGLAFTAMPTMTDGAFVLDYKLVHESGEFIHGVYPLPDPRTTKPQMVGSMITYARRYCLCAVTGVAPGGDDDDAGTAQAEFGSAGEAAGGRRSGHRAGRRAARRGQATAQPGARPGEGTARRPGRSDQGGQGQRRRAAASGHAAGTSAGQARPGSPAHREIPRDPLPRQGARRP
jgi:hypothetical protein